MQGAKQFNPNRPAALSIGVALLLFIAFCDYATGIEIGFSVFYLFPIAFVTWYAGRFWGITYAGLGTFLWLANDYWLGGNTYPHSALHILDSASQKVLFSTTFPCYFLDFPRFLHLSFLRYRTFLRLVIQVVYA